MVQKSKYSWQIFKAGSLFADLTGLVTSRKFVQTRNDSDEITFSISMDKLISLAGSLHCNVQDIFQSWQSEVRVSRYGTVLTAGELMPWQSNVGGDRLINLTFRGWFDLLKWRRTSDSYTSKSALYIAQDLFTKTLARAFGNQGNYNGFALGAAPSPDNTNVYAAQTYDQKTLYDAIVEMSAENNGFDFEMTWDKKFNIYYPSIGQVRSDIVFSYPHGNVKDIQYSVDPTKSFNSLTARGKGSGVNQLSVTVSDSASQQENGLREDVKDFSNVDSTDQLTNLAQSDINLYKQPIVLHTIVFDGSGKTSAPQVGTFHIGDQVRVAVSNFQLYQDVNQFLRINKIQVEIDENDMETVTIDVSVPNT